MRGGRDLKECDSMQVCIAVYLHGGAAPSFMHKCVSVRTGECVCACTCV